MTTVMKAVGGRELGGRRARWAALAAVAAIWVGAAAPAQASLTDAYPSNDCASGNQQLNVIDGWVLNEHFTLRAAKDPADPRNTWVCIAVQHGTAGSTAPGTAHFGGKVHVRTPSLQVVRLDNQAGACDTTGTTLYENGGHVRDIPWSVDVTRVGPGIGGEVWVCVSAGDGTVAKRVIIDTDVAAAAFTQDPAANYDYPSPSPPMGSPSSTCQWTPYHTRELNIMIGSYRIWLYTWKEGAERADVCFRVADTSPSPLVRPVGGLLSLDTSNLVTRSVDESPDFSPCPENELSLDDPAIQLRHSRAGASPAWVCVQAGPIYRRVSVSALPGGPPARLTLDP